ncbi:MAG: cysteine hydrolase [Clostridium sp.]|nr:MAG: cysteine hydrolase [Clostridium sp.]
MKSLKEVVITGCCTDICVMNLAIPLVNYFDEHDRDVKVRVPQNAVETFDSETHDRHEYNRVALRLMKNQGIGVENI